MILRVVVFACLMCLALYATALASPFDDWTAEEIFAHPDFVRSTDSMSQATNSGDPAEAGHVYWWVGYIPVGDERIYFTSFGEALTCVKWDVTGEWVPKWVVSALDRLVDEGLITFP
jgi:hypothetical protein